MTEVRELATGLRFPEGPIAMDDGSVVLVEIERGTLTRVATDGAVEVVADLGGGPNGAAIGPDGAVYVCNNGGNFTYLELGDLLVPMHEAQDSWSGGSIQRVDLETGDAETLYDSCDGNQLRGPNDIVFDRDGGMWFTDFGAKSGRQVDIGAVYYAKADGSQISEGVFGLDSPNGIGLSPDGSRLYVAETYRGRVFEWDITGPGELSADNPLLPHGGRLLAGFADLRFFDSLAVDGDGWVCVATIGLGGITAVSPDGERTEHTPLDDTIVTHVCFGGDDGRTAFAPLSSTGRLVSFDWPRPGLELAFR